MSYCNQKLMRPEPVEDESNLVINKNKATKKKARQACKGIQSSYIDTVSIYIIYIYCI